MLDIHNRRMCTRNGVSAGLDVCHYAAAQLSVVQLAAMSHSKVLHRLGFCLVCTASSHYTAGRKHQTGVHCPPQHTGRARASSGAQCLLVRL